MTSRKVLPLGRMRSAYRGLRELQNYACRNRSYLVTITATFKSLRFNASNTVHSIRIVTFHQIRPFQLFLLFFPFLSYDSNSIPQKCLLTKPDNRKHFKYLSYLCYDRVKLYFVVLKDLSMLAPEAKSEQLSSGQKKPHINK